jgi:hypothetical protein
MSVTKVKLNSQTTVVENVDWKGFAIQNVLDPVNDQDAATKAFVVNQIASGSGTIGAAEDGAYTDGLFTDFTPTTPTGTAVDRFNEVLKSLSPQPAPSFSSISSTVTGVSGKLSFGSSNVVSGYTNVPAIDINGAYAVSGTRLGIINGTTAIGGVLANNVAPGYANSRPYPNYAFGDGDQGSLHLIVNGVVIKTVNLATFASGSTLTVGGSGFTLSAATSVAFTNGDLFSVFKYRTGNWTVTAADQRAGFNTAQVRHEYATGLYRDSQAFEWVVDSVVTATSFSSEALNTLAMSGSRRLSGVDYHTSGTAKYGVTIANAVRNTYSSSASAINFTGTNATIVDEAIPTITTESDSLVLANKTATINATRLLNGSFSVNTQLDRTVQSDATSTGSAITGILIDNTVDNATITTLIFNGEGRRINSGLNLSLTNYGTGTSGSQPSPWDSSLSLVGADANHNSGLQVYNGLLQYPKTNFSLIANGPAGNVDYSTASGLRTFIGFFYDAGAHSNFRFNVTGSSIAFVPVATGPSGNNLTFEVLAPNTSKNAGGTVVWKDAVVAHSGTDTDLGCYASTYGATVPTAWGCTLGAKNTSTAGNVIVVKITAAAAWTGSISQVAITWL